MTKETFITLMTELVRLKEIENKFSEAIRQMNKYCNTFDMFYAYEDIAYKAIKEAMNDKNSWIGYWLYDCEMGKNKLTNSIKDKDGKKIPFKTLSDLYDCIKKN